MKAWQVPIFAQRTSGLVTAHWFERSQKTNVLVKTACGIQVNPDFAKELKRGVRRCIRCQRAV